MVAAVGGEEGGGGFEFASHMGVISSTTCVCLLAV